MQSQSEQLSAFMCLCCGERLPYPKNEQEAHNQQLYGCRAISDYKDEKFYQQLGINE